MATLHNNVFDNGLSQLSSNVENLYICSQEPTTFTEASTDPGSGGYKLGTKSGPSIANPSDRSAGGREVVVAQITDGSVGYTGTATHYALTDDSTSTLLATGSLSGGGQSVTSGNTFSLTEFAIGIPDPS